MASLFLQIKPQIFRKLSIKLQALFFHRLAWRIRSRSRAGCRNHIHGGVGCGGLGDRLCASSETKRRRGFREWRRIGRLTRRQWLSVQGFSNVKRRGWWRNILCPGAVPREPFAADADGNRAGNVRHVRALAPTRGQK